MHLSQSRVIDFDISELHCEDLSLYQTITLLLQSEPLNKLRFTPLSTTGGQVRGEVAARSRAGKVR